MIEITRPPLAVLLACPFLLGETFAVVPESETVSDAGAISVTSATYSTNCRSPEGNATSAVAAACDGKRGCEYVVDYRVLGDPAVGCGKTFVTVWQCGEDPAPLRHEVPAEAFRVRIWRNGAERTLDLVAPGSMASGGPGPGSGFAPVEFPHVAPSLP